MNINKIILFILKVSIGIFLAWAILIIYVIGCHDATYVDYTSKKIYSSSGQYYLIGHANRNDAEELDYYDVFLQVYRSSDKSIVATQSFMYTSDMSRLAFGWAQSGDTILYRCNTYPHAYILNDTLEAVPLSPNLIQQIKNLASHVSR